MTAEQSQFFPRVYNWNIRIYMHTYVVGSQLYILRKTDPKRK